MSGGSLNYLYIKEPGDLFNHHDDLQQVEGFLLALGYKDIAKDVRRLIEYIQSAENRIGVLHEQLKNVFHAVEWAMSGDYGRDTLYKELDKYRKAEG